MRLLDLPTGGTPPVLRDWDDWNEATAGDDTRRHWDAWPRPEYGTLEVRVMDMQTDVRRAAGFADLVRALVLAVADEAPPPYDRDVYARRREAATREPPDPAEVDELAALVEPPLPASSPRTCSPAGPKPSASSRSASTLPPQDVVVRTLAF